MIRNGRRQLGRQKREVVPILARLTNLYESRGILISTGLNPSDFGNFALAPFTWFIAGGSSLTNGLGIALQEIYFLECLFERCHPRQIFVIGNSSGWSTFALALLNPSATVVAIDAGFDENALEGIEFTNRVAAEEGMSACAVKGVSPRDVAPIVAERKLAPIDCILIDGDHSVAQVEADFDAVRPYAAPHCIYLFHDVQSFDLHKGLEHIAAKSGLVWDLLLATPSGMAVMYDPANRPPALDDIAPFIAHSEALEVVRRAAWSHRHRHLARWRTSLRKRLSVDRK
jgi:Methyltransferase domain